MVGGTEVEVNLLANGDLGEIRGVEFQDSSILKTHGHGVTAPAAVLADGVEVDVAVGYGAVDDATPVELPF